jgi:hypothetical protein
MGLIRRHIGEDFKSKVSRWMTESGYLDFLYKGSFVAGVALDSDLKIAVTTIPGAHNTIRFLAQHQIDLPIYISFKMPSSSLDIKMAAWSTTGPAQVLDALNKYSGALEGLQWVSVIKGQNQVVFEKKNGEWVKTHSGNAYLY